MIYVIVTQRLQNNQNCTSRIVHSVFQLLVGFVVKTQDGYADGLAQNEHDMMFLAEARQGG